VNRRPAVLRDPGGPMSSWGRDRVSLRLLPSGARRLSTAGRQRPLAIAWIVVAFGACAALEAPCPCGGQWQDPRGSRGYGSRGLEQTQASVPHSRSDHCVCQCGGEGEELYMPPFETNCRGFETACINADGEKAKLVCR
jgi:hypothetical protein